MQINISTIDDVNLTWDQFISDLLQPHNSINELKEARSNIGKYITFS